MFDRSDDLAIVTFESEKEKCFKQKCIGLINYYGMNALINYAQDPVMFNSIFTNAITTEREIHLILLKKFYLTNHENILYGARINSFIEKEEFNEIENLMKKQPMVKGILMGIYLENLFKTNHDLSIIKTENTKYERINSILYAMTDFYTKEYRLKEQQIQYTKKISLY